MAKNQSFDKIVPDTSVIIEGILSEKITKQELQVQEVLIHEAVLAELEHQANAGRAIGWVGLDEVKALQTLCTKGTCSVRFAGKRPGPHEIRNAAIGEIDALIRQFAYDEDATLVTADKVQARVAEAKAAKVLLIEQTVGKVRSIKLETFFDPTTMSVHLREQVQPMAKKGSPGSWEMVAVGKKELTAEDVKDISREIIEEARSRTDGFIEIERAGSTIIQLGKYRIVICKPPFSDGWEITAVRPVVKLTLDDYKLSDKMTDRIALQAEGMLIAGAPGNGKTTFAQALAEHFAGQKKTVKTVEAPRDLMLPENVTQLAISRGSPEEIHDVLLLSRPDYTVFDEMRNTGDFKLYADLRLAGVGMVGVVHGTGAIDAIQRFIGRLELGVIPQVVDTLVFIKNGAIAQVLSIKMIVKVPAGMTEADLARPVVVISDFETNKEVAEIYSYGEETVVIPVAKVEKKSGASLLAARSIERALQRYAEHVTVDVVSEHKAVVYVPKKAIAGIIGREGKNINQLEKELGVSIDVRELGTEDAKPEGTPIAHELAETSKYFECYFNKNLIGTDVDLYTDDQYLATFNVGKKSVVRIKKSNPVGKTLIKALKNKEKIRFMKNA